MLVTVDLSDKSRIEPCEHALALSLVTTCSCIHNTIGESDDLSPRGQPSNFWSNTRDILSSTNEHNKLLSRPCNSRECGVFVCLSRFVSGPIIIKEEKERGAQGRCLLTCSRRLSPGREPRRFCVPVREAHAGTESETRSTNMHKFGYN